MTYADTSIDLKAFLELRESELKSLVPKLGNAKKILRLQASVVCLPSMFIVTLQWKTHNMDSLQNYIATPLLNQQFLVFCMCFLTTG